ncbi:hypothetical protein TNIN_210251 [Trichonephila inaurata madagascariensis]|nr:hypothetical protein TNIN_210251 [Trichonephila inaurata madagascariensis]
MEKNEQLNVRNSFAVLNAENEDAEDVTPPTYKIKPIFMRLTLNYNLILQEINRTHPTAKNTHTKGKVTGKSATENRKRNENKQNTSPLVIPGLTFAQVSNPNKSQQMAAQRNASSASNQNQTKNNKNETDNKEAINAILNDNSELGYLQALLEIQKIFSLFPSLLSEMKKSQSCTNPADKINCLLKGVCSSFTSLTVNDA